MDEIYPQEITIANTYSTIYITFLSLLGILAFLHHFLVKNKSNRKPSQLLQL